MVLRGNIANDAQSSRISRTEPSHDHKGQPCSQPASSRYLHFKRKTDEFHWMGINIGTVCVTVIEDARKYEHHMLGGVLSSEQSTLSRR